MIDLIERMKKKIIFPRERELVHNPNKLAADTKKPHPRGAAFEMKMRTTDDICREETQKATPKIKCQCGPPKIQLYDENYSRIVSE